MNEDGGFLPSLDYKDYAASDLAKESPKETTFEIKRLLKIFLIAFLLAVIIKSFFIEANQIPSASMENTLLVGDFIIVNKVAYRFASPSNIPFTNIPIPSVTFFPICQPKRNDVIVFHFPGYQNEITPAQDENFIKRIIGLPGDTVEIKKGIVFINHKIFPSPYKALTGKSIETFVMPDDRIFPPGENWNGDNYGPLIVPRKGMTIKISPENIKEWETLIDRELKRRAVSTEGTVVTIDGAPVRSYTVKKNYYFVLGDNREDSMDSRYWGFVPDNSIIGKAVMIYWSQRQLNSSKSFLDDFNSIRFKRIFSFIR